MKLDPNTRTSLSQKDTPRGHRNLVGRANITTLLLSPTGPGTRERKNKHLTVRVSGMIIIIGLAALEMSWVQVEIVKAVGGFLQELPRRNHEVFQSTASQLQAQSRTGV